MQIAQRTSSSGIAAPSSGSKTSSTGKVDATGLSGQSAAPEQAAAASAAAPVARRGLSNWDQPLQRDISGAQQAVDFLEQSAAQLRALKAELSAKLANRQGRDGQVEARVRQFSDTWRNRQDASGGTLDSQLSYSSNESLQRFKVRGMTMGNLRHGARETLAIAVGNGAQGLRSVQLEPGLSDEEIVARFNQALAPVNISVSQGENGDLEFTTPEANWTTVRDTMAIQGGGIRYPTGQLNRVRTEAEAPVITPEHWQTSDSEALRHTLQQVVQALAHVEAALSKVNLALSDASQRATSAMPDVSQAGMDQAAQNFVSSANDPSYASLLSLTSALTGINRERVMALLGLRM